jgi:hypothetical protein
MYYTCLAPAAECRVPSPVGSWLDFVADPAALYKAQPPLVDANAVREALHAMCTDKEKQPPSYSALKAIFEVAHFMVTTPLHFVRLATPTEQDSLIAEGYHVCTKNELRDTYSAVQFAVLKETKSGHVQAMVPFIDSWLKDAKHRTYTKLYFLPPPLVCEPSVFNTFTGFDAERWDVEDSDDISKWRELLSLACNGDAKAEDILDKFFAQIAGPAPPLPWRLIPSPLQFVEKG